MYATVGIHKHEWNLLRGLFLTLVFLKYSF